MKKSLTRVAAEATAINPRRAASDDTVLLGCRVTRDFKSWFLSHCRAEGHNPSKLMRSLLEDYRDVVRIDWVENPRREPARRGR